MLKAKNINGSSRVRFQQVGMRSESSVVSAERSPQFSESSDEPSPFVDIELHQAFVSHFQQQGLASFFIHDIGAPARDRAEIRVYPRRAALLLQRQGRPTLLLCSSLQGEVRYALRPDHVGGATRDELMKGFLEKLGETVRDEARMHRLWYDRRSQALFEEAFRDDVAEIDKSLEDMVWRVASRFAALGGRQPVVSRGALYALFDGLFQRCLLRHLSGDRKAIADLREEVERLLPTVA